jgi:hypothetical protein
LRSYDEYELPRLHHRRLLPIFPLMSVVSGRRRSERTRGHPTRARALVTSTEQVMMGF